MSAYKLTELSPAEIKLAVEDLLKNHRYIFGVDPKTVSAYDNLIYYFTDMITGSAAAFVAVPPPRHEVDHQGPNDVEPRIQRPQLQLLAGYAPEVPDGT